MESSLAVSLPVFEGPLDLLLHLIEKNKIDIYDIPIAQVTDQYMDYVRQLQNEDPDLASSFLLMAATLLEIKSRMLLPGSDMEEEEDAIEVDMEEATKNIEKLNVLIVVNMAIKALNAINQLEKIVIFVENLDILVVIVQKKKNE